MLPWDDDPKTKEDPGELTVMDFPAKSSDPTPFEHLWELLKTEKGKHSVTLPEECRSYTGVNMGQQVLDKLVELHAAIIKAKGGHGKY